MSLYRTGLAAPTEVVPSAVKPYLELASGVRTGAQLVLSGGRDFYGRGISGRVVRPRDVLGFVDSIIKDAYDGVSLVAGMYEVGACFGEASRLIQG